MAEVCYPSETALPLDHIVLRLEQLSAGEWPSRQKPLEDYQCVADAMVKVCSDQATPHYVCHWMQLENSLHSRKNVKCCALHSLLTGFNAWRFSCYK